MFLVQLFCFVLQVQGTVRPVADTCAISVGVSFKTLLLKSLSFAVWLSVS